MEEILEMWKQQVSEAVVKVCCSMLHCDVVWIDMLQCVAVCGGLWRYVFGNVQALFVGSCGEGVLQCVAVCCSVLQCVAVCCSVLQCGAAWYSVL